MLINETKLQAELKLEREVKNSQNKSKMKWKFLNRFRKKGPQKEEVKIYEDGKELDNSVAKEKFFEGWEREVYGANRPREEKWEMGPSTQGKEVHVDHSYTGMGIVQHRPIMVLPEMTVEDLTDIIKKIKRGKAPGCGSKIDLRMCKSDIYDRVATMTSTKLHSVRILHQKSTLPSEEV